MALGVGSEVEEGGFALALQNDVPFENAAALAPGDEGWPPRGRDETEERIASVRGLVREIHARRQLLEQAAHEDRHHEVRRLGPSLRPRHRTGLDRREAERAARVGRDPAEAAEALVEGLFLLVLRIG